MRVVEVRIGDAGPGAEWTLVHVGRRVALFATAERGESSQRLIAMFRTERLSDSRRKAQRLRQQDQENS